VGAAEGCDLLILILLSVGAGLPAMTASQPSNPQLPTPNPTVGAAEGRDLLILLSLSVGASLLAKAVAQLTNIFRSHSIPAGAGLPAMTA
jgi:hypothetical protein